MLESEEGGGTALTKFARQAADLTAVFLYKEGLFVRAYNEGAYGFIHQGWRARRCAASSNR